MSEDDEEFSHTFRRYTKVLERQTKLTEQQLAMTERELRKSHGLQFELESAELRVKLGRRVDEIRAHIKYLKSLPSPSDPIMSGLADYGGIDNSGSAYVPMPPYTAGHSLKYVMEQLEQHAQMLIEWAAHLNPDKIYVLSTHDWQTLFHQPTLRKELA